MYAPDGRFGADPTKARDALVASSFEAGVAEATKRFGPDMAAWKWGDEKLHHALIRHPLSRAVNAEMKKKLEVGPLPRGGDGTTVSATGGNDNQMSGGSLEIITDTQDWDNSIGLNTPGQSGDPDNPHYRDLFDLWAKGRYFPVAYSRAKVESVAERTTSLTPAAASTSGARPSIRAGRRAPASSTLLLRRRPPATAARCARWRRRRSRRPRRRRAASAWKWPAPAHPRAQHVKAVVVDAAGASLGLAAPRSNQDAPAS